MAETADIEIKLMDMPEVQDALARAQKERDDQIKVLNRLCALVAKHIAAKTDGDPKFTHFADEADEALHAGYRRVIEST